MKSFPEVNAEILNNFVDENKNSSQSQQVFQKVGEKQNPPDQMTAVLQMFRDLSQKVENIQKEFQTLRK